MSGFSDASTFCCCNLRKGCGVTFQFWQAPQPTASREHAARLNSCLHGVLYCIDRTQSYTVLAYLVKTIMYGTMTFILKVQHAPDLITVCGALSILQTKTKSTSETTAQILNAIKTEFHHTIATVRTLGTIVKQNANTGEEARAVEVSPCV